MSQMQALPRKTFASSALTGSYQAIDSGYTSDIQIFKILNEGTTAVDVSYDGVTDHDRLSAGPSGFILDVTANKYKDRTALPVGTKIWVKGTAGTGNIYLIAYTEPVGN